jgi:hypothetical protein
MELTLKKCHTRPLVSVIIMVEVYRESLNEESYYLDI